METAYFMDFGRGHGNCQVMDEGFVLWKISTGEDCAQLLLDGGGAGLIVHMLLTGGEMKIGWGGRRYRLTKGCFANFIDSDRLEVRDISGDAEGYALIFSSQFITSLLKNTPPFPPSYVLKIKIMPIYVISSETMGLFLKRIGDMEQIFRDREHSFRTEMLKCGLWMLMMDMADTHLRQDGRNDAPVGSGRKSILFQNFIRLLLENIREEHSAGWYASQLCVSPQYLNRAVKEISHKTVYDHICRTLTGAVTEQLENTDAPVSQIAEGFNFPDQATLTKFFKRQTGMTPTEYRKRMTDTFRNNGNSTTNAGNATDAVQH